MPEVTEGMGKGWVRSGPSGPRWVGEQLTGVSPGGFLKQEKEVVGFDWIYSSYL